MNAPTGPTRAGAAYELLTFDVAAGNGPRPGVAEAVCAIAGRSPGELGADVCRVVNTPLSPAGVERLTGIPAAGVLAAIAGYPAARALFDRRRGRWAIPRDRLPELVELLACELAGGQPRATG